MEQEQPQFLKVVHPDTGEAVSIAVRQESGDESRGGVFWLSGFNSDMLGGKAVAVSEWARTAGLSCTRMDYSGHGESGGAFTDGSISRWLREAEAVFETCTTGPQIVIGSSMGGWIALLLARARLAAGGRVKALVLIAPAADMTGRLMWDEFTPEIREQILQDGQFLRPSEYGEPYPITRKLIDDGPNHFILTSGMSAGCPVRILHGMQDADVPWQLSIDIIGALAEDDVTLTLVKDGDHRLSRDEDIARLLGLLGSLA